MDKVQPITRRAALIGALVSSAALAAPAAASVNVAENPHDKVRRLQRELCGALAELASYNPACDYVAITYPEGTAKGHGRRLIERDIFEEEQRRETALALTAPRTLGALAAKFRDDARIIDPRIVGCFVGYDETLDGPREERVMHIYLERKHAPFKRRRNGGGVDDV